MEPKPITLMLTREQEEQIQGLFAFNGWDYHVVENPCNHHIPDEECAISSVAQQSVIDDNKSSKVPRPRKPEDLPDNNCPYCFLDPCITTLPSPWLGHRQAPNARNAGLRKSCYKKFWCVMQNLGAWNNQHYLDRKAMLASGQWAVLHRREVMPKCILNCVRSVYPNPPGQPYMGHKWE